REIHQDRAGLEQAEIIVAIDDRGDAVVRADLEEIRRELLVLADVDRMHGVGEANFFQHDGSLAAVRRRPGVKVDHFVRSLGSGLGGNSWNFIGRINLADTLIGRTRKNAAVFTLIAFESSVSPTHFIRSGAKSHLIREERRSCWYRICWSKKARNGARASFVPRRARSRMS